MDSIESRIPVTDVERSAVVERLRDAVGAGLLELEEFSGRVDEALVAPDRGALALVVRDLESPEPAPAPNPDQRPDQRPDRRPTSWLLGVMGGGDRRGRWMVAEKLRVFNVMGGAELDLRTASISARVTTITVISIMGGSTIRVPDGIEVELSGFAIMGGNHVRISGPRPPEGSPVLRVQAYSIMGGTHVKGEKVRRREQLKRLRT